MVSQPARRLRSSRQNRGKPAKSANPTSAPERPLKIGEAARELGVEAYVLRFWETQFPDLRPYHTATKHRLYGAQDMETLLLIKRLLYEEGFTIEGARKRIKELAQEQGHSKAGATNSSAAKSAKAQTAAKLPVEGAGRATRQTLVEIRRDLESLYHLLKD
ncbi:MAG TPA: MerR family transcriptional regulator [Candidatus Binataceae bacterium]|jgi:DNA-binding transcriptional MerR regulator|nr:MerR family transcriptional regulator [Candidatus Binataceae bacterium]